MQLLAALCLPLLNALPPKLKAPLSQRAKGWSLTVAGYSCRPHCVQALEICDRVKNVLGPDAECTIAPAQVEEPSHLGASSSIIRRK